MKHIENLNVSKYILKESKTATPIPLATAV